MFEIVSCMFLNVVVLVLTKHSTDLIQGGETDFIISVLFGTLLFCEANSYLFFCLKTGELQ